MFNNSGLESEFVWTGGRKERGQHEWRWLVGDQTFEYQSWFKGEDPTEALSCGMSPNNSSNRANGVSWCLAVKLEDTMSLTELDRRSVW